MNKTSDNFAIPTMKRIYKDFKMPTICKRCYYRRTLWGMDFVKDNNWSGSCCAYHLMEGEFRNCETTDDYCGKFRKRGSAKK